MKWILGLAIVSFFGGRSMGAEKDLFDILEKSPAEIVATLPSWQMQDQSSNLTLKLIDVPMSVDHRDELLTLLKARAETTDGVGLFARRVAMELLEEDGLYDDALSLNRSKAKRSQFDRSKEISLLWKKGEIEEAAGLLLALKTVYVGTDWIEMIQQDLLKSRPQRAIDFLQFLDSKSVFKPAARLAFLRQRIQIVDAFNLDDERKKFSESITSQAVYLSLIRGNNQAIEFLQNSSLEQIPARDFPILFAALPNRPLLLEEILKRLIHAEISTAERTELIAEIDDPTVAFDTWISMKSGHAETINIIGRVVAQLPLNKRSAARAKFQSLFDTFPDRPEFHSVMIELNGSEPDLNFLKKAGQLFRPKAEISNPLQDPASLALKYLAEIEESAALDQLILHSSTYRSLPIQDQIRYLIVAGLDQRVIEKIKDTNFETVAMDSTGKPLADYFRALSFESPIPPESLAILLNRSPHIICGSRDKPDADIMSETFSWIQILKSTSASPDDLLEFCSRLIELSTKRGDATKDAVIQAISSDPVLRKRLIPADTQIANRNASMAPVPEWLSALSLFSNPPLDPDWQSRDPMMARPSVSLPGSASIFQRSLWIDHFSLWIRGHPIDANLLAKLRQLFPEPSPRNRLYDIFIGTGFVQCPDPALKTSAVKRLETVSSEPSPDPRIVIFLFLKKVENGESIEQAGTILEELRQISASKKSVLSERFIHFRSGFSGHKMDQANLKILTALFEKSTTIPAAKPPEQPKPLSAYDRLQLFQEAGRQNSREAVAFAKDVIFTYLGSSETNTRPTENLAIALLVDAGNFEKFIEELKSKMENEGAPELQLQDALFRVHLYEVVHTTADILPYAQRVFELDPTRLDAALFVLKGAIASSDRSLALRCIAAFQKKSKQSLAGLFSTTHDYQRNDPSRDPLALFTGVHARELVNALIHSPMPAMDEENRANQNVNLNPLYYHIITHDPESLLPVLNWANALRPENLWGIFDIAVALEQAGRKEEGLRYLADLYFKPLPADHPKVRIAGARFKSPSSVRIPSLESLRLLEIKQRNWLKPLSELSSAYPKSSTTDGTRFLFEIANDPTIRTWQRISPSILQQLPKHEQENLRRIVGSLIGNYDNAAELIKRLDDEMTLVSHRPPTLDELSKKVYFAVEAEKRPRLKTLWEQLKIALNEATEAQRRDTLIRISNSISHAAEDEVWAEFVETLGQTVKPTDTRFESFSLDGILSAPINRVDDFAKFFLPQFDSQAGSGREEALKIFDVLVAHETPNATTLKLFTPFLNSLNNKPLGRSSLGISSRLQLIEQLEGRVTAVTPQIFAIRQPDSTIEFYWSLSGFNEDGVGFPFSRKSVLGDRMFDLTILAGQDVEKLERVEQISATTATGKITLRIPENFRHAALIAQQIDGPLVRISKPITLTASAEHFLAVSPSPDAGDYTVSVNSDAPFGLEDSRKISMQGSTDVDVAVIPWTGGKIPVVSGWVDAVQGNVSLRISCRKGDEQLRAISIETSAKDIAVLYSKPFGSPDGLEAPAGTDRILLTAASRSGDVEKDPSIKISGLRVIPTKPQEFPPALQRVGKIPGDFNLSAFDPETQRMAVSSLKLGVGVYHFKTQEFSGWLPDETPSGELPGVEWLALRADRIVRMIGAGDIFVTSISKRTTRKLFNITDFDPKKEAMKDYINLMERGSTPGEWLRLSPLGDFVVWPGRMAGLHIANISSDTLIGRRLLETPQSVQPQVFQDADSLEIRDYQATYSLPLNQWMSAAPTVIASKTRTEPGLEKWQLFVNHLNDPATNIQLSVVDDASEADLFKMSTDNRVLRLPPGKVGVVDGKLFYISALGDVYLIDPTKIEGYTPRK